MEGIIVINNQKYVPILRTDDWLMQKKLAKKKITSLINDIPKYGVAKEKYERMQKIKNLFNE